MNILIIDDERSVRNSLGEILRDEGYTVEVAEDGKYVLCVTHDAFAVSCIGTLTGHSFEDDWIDFLDGCVLFRYGDVWKLCWREGECVV